MATPDGQVVACNDLGQVTLVDVESGEVTRSAESGIGASIAATLSTSNEIVVAGNHQLRLGAKTVDFSGEMALSAMAQSPEGRIALGTRGGQVTLVEPPLEGSKTSAKLDSRIRQLAFLDEQTLLAATESGLFQVNLRTGHTSQPYELEGQSARSIDVSGDQIVVGCSDDCVRFFSTGGGAATHQVLARADDLALMSLTRLAIRDRHELQIIDVDTGSPVMTFGPPDSITTLAWFPEREILVTGAYTAPSRSCDRAPSQGPETSDGATCKPETKGQGGIESPLATRIRDAESNVPEAVASSADRGRQQLPCPIGEILYTSSTDEYTATTSAWRTSDFSLLWTSTIDGDVHYVKGLLKKSRGVRPDLLHEWQRCEISP